MFITEELKPFLTLAIKRALQNMSHLHVQFKILRIRHRQRKYPLKTHNVKMERHF